MDKKKETKIKTKQKITKERKEERKDRYGRSIGQVRFVAYSRCWIRCIFCFCILN